MQRFLLAITFLAIPLPGSAYITATNSRIDRALYDAHDQKTIVYGTITKEHRLSDDTTGYRVKGGYQVWGLDGPDLQDMNFKIEGVIMGHDSLVSKTIFVRLNSFEWPDALVEIAPGTRVILILDPDSYDAESPYYLYTVVPCVSADFKKVDNNSAAKSLLSTELLKVLTTLTEDQRIRETLLQVAPILAADQWEAITPHLLNNDLWVQRAAIATLVYATEDDRAIKLAAGNIQGFISTTPEDSLIKNIREGYQYAPYPFYKNYMFFINSYCWNDSGVWSQEEKDKDCRIMEKILATNIIDKRVLAVLKEKF